MAYNLQPLIQILEHILHPHHHHRHNWILDHSKKPIIETLLDKARSIQEFFENPPSVTAHGLQRLENRIRDSAYLAQNIIESYLVGQFLPQPKGGTIFISPPYNILRIIEGCEFEHILGEIRKITVGNGDSSSNLVSSLPDLSTTQDLNPKNIKVGITEDVTQLMDHIIMPQESKLEVIPIVGMGGIGKTTLARTLYDDQSIVSYFDSRAWVVISQSYNEQELSRILSGLLKCIAAPVKQSNDNDLGLQLYQALFNRRYLVVLDDIWSFDAWDSIKMSFPNQNNGSRILVTTREQRVANYVANTQNLHHQMKLLKDVDSWKLLCRKVFHEESCTYHLEKVGKIIAKNCRGLPLAIHVIGGVLSHKPKTQEAWMQVAKDVSSSMANNQYEHISNILSLSYNHLSIYLKPCFLYMAAFPEDFEIRGSKLIRLWMAEGFVKPISGMSLEETARLYLKELVERNLLIVQRQETRSNVKSYIIHDLLRELCIKKAREEKFLYANIDAIKGLNPNEMLPLRLSGWASFDQFTSILKSSNISHAVVHSILFANIRNLSWSSDMFRLQLLKVLDTLSASCLTLPEALGGLANLRYLAVHIPDKYPYSIPNLYNLQTLIFHLDYGNEFVVNVRELLDMPQLRHIKFKGEEYYPHFVLRDEESVNVVNEELQTLSRVQIDDSFHRILKAIPNLKKLGIDCCSSTIDLSSLSQLQILKCSDDSDQWRRPLTPVSVNLIFPPSLKKLMLECCNICNGFLNEIGRLPNLQVFKLKMCWLDDSKGWNYCAPAEGEDDSMEWNYWKPAEGEFQKLRFLQLKFFVMKKWIADETHYPRLEHLIIDACYELEEIPTGIGEIPTLQIIEVHDSPSSIVKSARKIQEEQLDYGNDFLQVCINGSSL